MTLDLLALSKQIEEAVDYLRMRQEDRHADLRRALRAVSRWAKEPDGLRAKVQAAGGRVGFQVALPREPLDTTAEAPPAPAAHVVVAADGSQIDRDRHAGLDCVLINVGTATLRYGPAGSAELASEPTLLCRSEDLYIADPANPEEREQISGALLHAKRDVMECSALAKTVPTLGEECAALCLLDNSLILWGLLGRRFDDYVRRALLAEYGDHLARIESRAREGHLVSLAGYISRPDSFGVVNLLRLAECPEPDCPSCAKAQRGRHEACHRLARLRDRDLFAALLPTPGSRSPVFDHPVGAGPRRVSPVDVSFFYLNTGEEIARVEIPAWVAGDRERLSFTHAALWSQTRLGLGYPAALVEAHEQAVVGGSDHDLFWSIVATASEARHLSAAPSLKSQSKRLRAL